MLRNLIRDTLKGNAVDEKAMKDGIAMAFCQVDLKNMQLHFSGSYNPLYHVRDGELKEIKAERIPIGHTGESEQEQGNFLDHIVDIKKGDVIYLFTDGYADQIGGPNKKKYFYGPFKELFLSIHKLPMEEQSKKLKTTINEWMGDREQLDDITVIGIRF
jgi:serine phosphatase RsbU (regulator of sigma subunit)